MNHCCNYVLDCSNNIHGCSRANNCNGDSSATAVIISMTARQTITAARETITTVIPLMLLELLLLPMLLSSPWLQPNKNYNSDSFAIAAVITSMAAAHH